MVVGAGGGGGGVREGGVRSCVCSFVHSSRFLVQNITLEPGRLMF